MLSKKTKENRDANERYNKWNLSTKNKGKKNNTIQKNKISKLVETKQPNSFTVSCSFKSQKSYSARDDCVLWEID